MAERPALPAARPCLDDARAQILAAQAALEADPSNADAALSKVRRAARSSCAGQNNSMLRWAPTQVEGLIACGRVDDALDATTDIAPPSCDSLYLRAEALLRQGELDTAARMASAATKLRPTSAKCRQLREVGQGK